MQQIYTNGICEDAELFDNSVGNLNQEMNTE